MTSAPNLRIVPGARGELEVSTSLIRRFLGIAPNEFVELTAFVEGRIHVAQCVSEADHVRLLREAERIRGFKGAYQLVNGLIDPVLSARYEQGRWHYAWNGRVADRDVKRLRALFLDVVSGHRDPPPDGEERQAGAGAVHRSPARIWASGADFG